MKSEHDKAPQDGGTENKASALWVFGGVICLWLFWSFAGQWVAHLLVGTKTEQLGAAGQFGDMFGSLNALFTALAFAAVFWSATMQRREMEMQRTELKLQREALVDQRKEMEQQRAVFSQQAFESTFFQPLEHCRALHERIRHSGMPGANSTMAMHELAAASLKVINEAARGDNPSVSVREIIGEKYSKEVLTSKGPSLAPYFRALFQLFKLIDAQAPTMSVEKRRSYANVARAHLANDDLIVLAVNACSTPGQGFRVYIEQFGLLKHIELSESPQHRKAIEACFAQGAFLGYAPDT